MLNLGVPSASQHSDRGLELDNTGGRPLHREKNWRREERRTGKKKRAKTW